MIEIRKLSKENRNFGFKLFFSYIIFTILLIISITIIHMYFSQDLLNSKFEREVRLQSSEKKDKFDKYLKTKEDALLAIAKNEYFLDFIKDGSYKYYIDLLLLTIMEANKDYMQIRYINSSGYEVLRLDRKAQSQEPYKSTLLQDKSSRYYFKETSKLKKNEVLFSKIDLNMEHGNIQKPYNPTLRVSTPLFIEDKFKGIFIINIFMEKLLKSLSKSSLYDIYLIDKDGYYLKDKYGKFDWSFYNTKRTIKDDFSKHIVEKIFSSKKDSFIYDKTFIQTLFIDNKKIFLIMKESTQSINQVKNDNNKMIITILIFATIMALIFTFIFTRALRRLFDLVVKQADKLHDLAINLDNKVVEKTLEITKKDRLLQNQNKLAELGDMIGNIAHQWRHPLTRLSLILQNLKAFKNKNKMTDKLFSESMENSLYQIEFMSSTIDNFKNFYKKDEKKSNFKIIEAIENVLNIIGQILEHKNIDFNISSKEDILIYANKNEFSQVLMNLIINAKDAIEDNNIKNGKIEVILIKDKKVKIEVKDNAKGIPNYLLNEIFNPYFTTKDERGTGIGLYLSKVIIEEKMKGKLYATNSNQGAIFTIIL